jgi:thymidylate synthase (FAD)
MSNDKIDVLDRGFVQYVEHMGSDLTVVNAARVSFNKESEWEHPDSHVPANILSEKDGKLISYLAKHQHWTPFAHPQITLRIKAPISIRTQLFKHKVGFVENEISRRYVSEKPDIYQPTWRSKPSGGAKQGSEDFMPHDSVHEDLCHHYHLCISESLYLYEKLIDKGVAPEQARFVLPQGTYTEWWWTGSLAAYARVYKQRSDPHAQWEVREYANAIGKIVEPLYPKSWVALTT